MEFIRELNDDDYFPHRQCPYCNILLYNLEEDISNVYEGNGLYKTECHDAECGKSFEFLITGFDITFKDTP